MTIVQNVQHLGRQGLAFRGHNDEESNFIQLLKLRSHDQPDISEWLARKGGDKYTSPEVQNELLTLMCHAILRAITTKVQQADFFSLMTDECVDCANSEQLAIYFRYVDSDLEVHEEFIGLYQCPSITADTIVTILKYTLL